ncbi:hypothetical protein D3C72_2337490 [compost metagenome]
MINDVLLHVLGPSHLGGYLNPSTTQILGLSLEQVAMVLQVTLPSQFSIAFFEQ